MDELASSVAGNLNGVAPANSTAYDTTLKKLIRIIKLRASDNLKQLEDLWDSINSLNKLSGQSPVGQSAANSNGSSRLGVSPVNVNSDNSNDSTNSVIFKLFLCK